MTIAYVYKWTHLPTLRWYIGSRSRKNCHPHDGYICSSKVVKPMVQQNPTEWVRQVLATGTPTDMVALETEMLHVLDAKNDPRSFNCHNGDLRFTSIGKVTRKGRSNSPRHRRAISESLKGRTKSLEHRQNLSKSKLGSKGTAGFKGRTHTEESKQKISESSKLLVRTEEHKRRIGDAHRGKPKPTVECPHCGKIGAKGNMLRYHFENCKLKGTLT